MPELCSAMSVINRFQYVQETYNPSLQWQGFKAVILGALYYLGRKSFDLICAMWKPGKVKMMLKLLGFIDHGGDDIACRIEVIQQLPSKYSSGFSG